MLAASVSVTMFARTPPVTVCPFVVSLSSRTLVKPNAPDASVQHLIRRSISRRQRERDVAGNSGRGLERDVVIAVRISKTHIRLRVQRDVTRKRRARGTDQAEVGRCCSKGDKPVVCGIA